MWIKPIRRSDKKQPIQEPAKTEEIIKEEVLPKAEPIIEEEPIVLPKTNKRKKTTPIYNILDDEDI